MKKDIESQNYTEDSNRQICAIICMVLGGYLSLLLMVISVIVYLSSIDAKDNNIPEMDEQIRTSYYIFLTGLAIVSIISISFKSETGVWAMVPASVGSSATLALFLLHNIIPCGVQCRSYLRDISPDEISNKALEETKPYFIAVILLSIAIMFVMLFVHEIRQMSNRT